ncbi:FAD-dependent oxidoreductase [Promethearchaeum syntrophicum]|uniref:FAD-dependent oxidoreductase n=1 Tax=Promethearchaeum syntrophicum TaxID=2594042 RepID=A0A5B9DE09_9ARCH|nr:FAD-dependent oxidoreductase [Candidatus Prometheoarchaeum syntrophicum]QEE17003.1 Coenzyme A disulfide reductase [Candidatus Prometheoarchaeum syntrophicum]
MKIIVIGANAAGLSAASAIRKTHKDWQIDVYEKDQYISYGSCGIPYYVSDDVKSLDSLITLTKEKMETKRKIPIHLFHEVKTVDFENKEVLIVDIKSGNELKENYDYLVITTGGKSNISKISSESNLDHPRVFKVHTLGHAKRLKDFLTTTKINSAVIIGGGYIGLEMLEAYEAQGVKNLTLVGPRLNFRSESQDFIRKELELHGVKIILKKRVNSIKSISDEKLKVILVDGEEIETDLVQLSIGVVPATDIFKNTKLDMLSNGAIIIDEFCRTNIENVYSAGDCATAYNRLLKKEVYSPLAPAANRLGRLAGTHIAGNKADPFLGIVGTAVFKVYDLYCAQTGISDDNAKKMGYNVQTSLITINELAHYYPGAKKMSILLRFDPDTHLLLGAEITAPSSLGAKKIDVFATALSMGMKIEDIQQLDLAYAPPFAPAWDPILVAVNVARKKCK